MEVDSVKDVFCRSFSEYGVKYFRYIGDGDSATHKGLIDLNPYDILVEKLECYLHVKKRIGTRCRNLKKTNNKLGGRSKTSQKLTVNLINQIQKYYGLAIMRNQDNVDEMYKAIWATFHHLCSTDKKPNHDNCPEGAESLCAYRRAEAEGMMIGPAARDYAALKDETRLRIANHRQQASSKRVDHLEKELLQLNKHFLKERKVNYMGLEWQISCFIHGEGRNHCSSGGPFF
nr:uncharacterized protein LOC124223421 isoform X2 [Neodiprion pinetum]